VLGANANRFRGADRPVERVRWGHAQGFCHKLGDLEDASYRLPTEAEWEHACRAGTRTRFFWGDDAERAGEFAWSRANSGGETHPVRRLLPNPWGLFDMAGNVYEWCADVYDPRVYARRTFRTKDPAPNPGTGEHVVRGGCFESSAVELRSAMRRRYRDDYKTYLRGFRVARSAL